MESERGGLHPSVLESLRRKEKIWKSRRGEGKGLLCQGEGKAAQQSWGPAAQALGVSPIRLSEPPDLPRSLLFCRTI